VPFETINSLSQQFWVGAEIPVGITDTNMPEVSRQDRQTRLNLVPATIPVQQCLHGKAVPEVVQTRSMARRWTAQPDLPRQGIERAVHITQVQSIAWFNQAEGSLHGVFTLRRWEDAKLLHQRLAARPQRVLVIGGQLTVTSLEGDAEGRLMAVASTLRWRSWRWERCGIRNGCTIPGWR
jgi:hypothetical protein